MRKSKLALAALLPIAVIGLAGCGTTAPVAGAAYGAATAATTAPGSMSASPTASGSGAPMVPAKVVLTVQQTKAGYVLANGTGRTVYWFGHDAKGGGKSTCTGPCASSWPPVKGTPVAAAGVKLTGALGTITRPGGVVQATYNGYPLYTYAGDTSPGMATGNGAGGGVWHVITGALLSPSPASAAAASAHDMHGGTAPAPSSSATAARAPGY